MSTSNKKPNLAQLFDHLAGRYDTYFTRWAGESELQQIRPLVPAKATVLDYGCGTGRTTIDLLKRGCTVTAYDFSQAMLDLARAKVRNRGLSAEFIEDAGMLSGRNWPLITCIGVADYYPDTATVLEALRGYLSPEGRIVITCPNGLGLLGWIYRLGSRLSIPVYPQTPAKMQRAADKSGFILHTYRFAFPTLQHVAQTIVFSLKSLD